MKPLLVLLTAFLIGLLAIKRSKGKFNVVMAANVAMATMLLFTSIGHFVFPKGMAMMLPSFLPEKEAVVFLTGLLEIVAAIGLLLPSWRTTTGNLLILFFVLILPANIIASAKGLNIEKGTGTGPGLAYLWFRVPLQLLFIAWVYYFSIKKKQDTSQS